jgi:hypothetical protein
LGAAAGCGVSSRGRKNLELRPKYCGGSVFGNSGLLVKKRDAVTGVGGGVCAGTATPSAVVAMKRENRVGGLATSSIGRLLGVGCRKRDAVTGGALSPCTGRATPKAVVGMNRDW